MTKLQALYLSITLCVCPAVSATDFYVAPTGNDQADGLLPQIGQDAKNGPFQTPARAQLAVRELKKTGQFKKSVTIHLAAGSYPLQKPLEFDIRDSGFPDKEITWQAENGVVILSGGLSLSNCVQGGGERWSCPVADLRQENKQFMDTALNNGNPAGFNLFVNQQRFHPARWPDKEWAHIKLPLDSHTTFTSMEPLPVIDKSADGMQVHIFPGNDWTDEYLPVMSADAERNEIKLSAKTAYPLESGRRFYLHNIRSELNAPEEWYYDKPNARIEFILAGRPAPENVVISSLPHLLNLKGAHHIRFQNLAFQYSTDIAINMEHSDHIGFDGVEISHIDTIGIQALQSTYITVSNSHIFDTGQKAIFLEGGDRNTLESGNNVVYNNHIHHFGVINYTYNPGVDSRGVGSRISHNLIENGAGNGVMINGNEHLFEKNEVSHVCEQASDCGAVYSGRNWTYYGNMIRYNSFHDFYGQGLLSADPSANTVKYGPSGARGVYLDDGLAGFSVIGNIFNNAGSMNIHLAGGRGHHIENNVFYTDGVAIYISDRGPDYDWSANRKTLTGVPIHSPIWQAKYPELGLPMKHDTWPENNTIKTNIIISSRADGIGLVYTLPMHENTLSNNLVWGANGKFGISFNILDSLKKGITPWAEWMSLGIELNSIEADPCATISANKVTFCANSPMRQIGFQPIPADIGLIRGTKK